ncbi:MAG: energy transducer TonB [Gammaproteobacteria bacterium]|nr:energy transducer TonB [Gammaproteobacteria bacterium]
MSAVQVNPLQLPWLVAAEEERRFKRILILLFAVVIVIGSIIPYLRIPELHQSQIQKVPPRLAKVLLERKKKPTVEQKKKQEVEKKKKEKKKRVEKARKKASRSGLLALKGDLAALRSSPALSKLKSGTKLSKLDSTRAASSAPTRSLIGSDVTKRSAGIDTSNLSRDTGGQGLAGRETTQVGSASLDELEAFEMGASDTRSREEIELIFEENKNAIFSMYNRALRKDPSLEGKVVLEITIDPSGQVTSCRVISSELNDARLERRLVTRVKLFDFGPKDVPTITVTYPINFIPD